MKEENIFRFMKDGKITVLPKKQKNKMEIFEFIYAHLKNHSETYHEKELNEKIKELYDDFATMRRYLVDYNAITIRYIYNTVSKRGFVLFLKKQNKNTILYCIFF